MRLKRVRIFGFKTFADKTELDLDGNLIAIVGPNGCGKSNIVDAIMWGLGEPNARNIRAQTSSEIIFSGSSQRKQIGFAEVSLLFDNEDGALAVDSPEVVVTRKVNRSGESDYSINRRNCRQRDLYDLFADSGLGRAGYAIVSQKGIDAALAASPDERRAWVDEAAGVQRYRAKRIESLKRLEAASQHLERVDDILREIEHQREPLEIEAETAKRYREIAASLREVESGLLIKEVAKAIDQLGEIEKRLKENSELVKKERERSEELEHAGHRTAESISKLEQEMDALREKHQEALTAAERTQGALQLAEQKLKSLDEFESNLTEESDLAKKRLLDAHAQLELASKEEKLEADALERLRVELAGAGAEADSLRRELAEAEESLEQAQRAHAEWLKFEAERTHRKQRAAEIARELKGIQETLPDLEKGVQEAESVFQQSEAKLQTVRADGKNAEEATQNVLRDREEKDTQRRKLLQELASFEGRQRGIEATIEAHEGLTHGSRGVFLAIERGLLKGSFVPVAEAIDTEKRFALAIETALGGAFDDLIVPEESVAKRAIEVLKEHRLGRATFQPISLMRPKPLSPDLEKVLINKGVLGRASELVSFRKENGPVIESQLGRVIVVENLEFGLKLAKTSGWSKLVTLEGELIQSSGAVTGGSTGKPSSGVIQRKAELNELKGAIADRSKQITVLEKSLAELGASLEALHSQREASRTAEAETTSERDDARQWLNSLQHELQGTIREKNRLSDEQAKLVAESTEPPRPADLVDIQAARDALMGRLAARSADSEGAKSRLDEAELRHQQATHRRVEAERRLAHAGDADSARERRLSNLDTERAQAARLIERHEAELETAKEGVSNFKKLLDDASEERKKLLEESFRLAEESKDAQRNAAAANDLMHQAELSRARLDAQRAASLQRLLEEYGVTQEEALESAPTIEVPADAAPLVSKLRRELKSMGEVNLGAIEAYERLTERYEELTVQRGDIVAGKMEVESAIRELDKLTRDRFKTTFEALQTQFSVMFRKLFEGGEGYLSLTNPDDLLSTGVEVEVVVPGKKKQRLELLSGGERAMSASAFLFSLLKVKPSPLVVLDEVDAPLDGRNVERFLRVLKEFEGTTQFILITHNPVTIETAPIWLGVTMQEPGVTSVIPCRAPESALVASAGEPAYMKG